MPTLSHDVLAVEIGNLMPTLLSDKRYCHRLACKIRVIYSARAQRTISSYGFQQSLSSRFICLLDDLVDQGIGLWDLLVESVIPALVEKIAVIGSFLRVFHQGSLPERFVD